MKLWMDQLWPHPMEWGYNWMILWRRRAVLAQARAATLERLVGDYRTPIGVILGGGWVVLDALEWDVTIDPSPRPLDEWDDTSEVSG